MAGWSPKGRQALPAPAGLQGSRRRACPVPSACMAVGSFWSGLALGHPEEGQAALRCGYSSGLGISPRLGIVPPRHKSVPSTGKQTKPETEAKLGTAQRDGQGGIHSAGTAFDLSNWGNWGGGTGLGVLYILTWGVEDIP